MPNSYCFVQGLVAGLVAVAVLAPAAPAAAQRSDRATISGVVTDEQGAAVPGATVTIKNDDTGVSIAQVTNASGAYTAPPLILGRYSVTVDIEGFKRAVTSGILLQGGDAIRHDVALQVGALSETVQVVSNEGGLADTRPDVSHTVNEKYYRELPIVTASDVRLAEAVLQIQPGYLPMRPNGEPMFRGSQFNSRINGGQARATENVFDGAAFGYAVGHQGSQESTPPVESVQEVKVITTSFSAQYGHTSGGFIEYSSKSGTNAFHGSLYEYFAHDALNAKGFFAIDKTPLRNDNFGGVLGGPVLLGKLYNGRNKTFFFTNIDYTRIRSGVLPGFGNTTPIPAFRNGDFSALLTGNQVGVDALGRAIMGGQIFNPSTTRLVNGVPVRDPYLNNQIPAGDPLRSQVASRLAALMVQPDRAGLANNVAGNPAGDQTWELNARNILGRLDHVFTPNFRMSHTFYWNRRPSIRNCGGVGGCATEFSGESEPAKNTSYIGEGFYQRISTHHAHQQFDWVIRDNLLNHSTVAYDRWFMGGNSLSAGANWPQALWGNNQGGLVDTTAGPPVMTFGGNTPYSAVGQNWTNFGFLVNNRWQFSNDLTWVKGRHSVKTGIEFRYHDFPFKGWGQATGGQFNFNRLGTAGYDAQGNNLSATGDPFASFLLGQVQDASQTIPVQPTFREFYTAGWINDEFKVSDKLTLTLGMRLDYQSARTETMDQYSTFDPNTPNPGAGGIPGALIFAGDGDGRSGRRTFENPPIDAWGPRAGFAYRLGEKQTVRGGYGIYYSGVAFDQFVGQPTVGFQANLLAPNDSNGVQPAFYLDNGFPQSRVTQPPFINPTFANNNNVIAVPEDGLTLPRFQNWSATYQRQLTENMMLDVSYIGNRGTRLNHHAQTLGVGANMNDPSVLALGTNVLQSNINSDVARNAGITSPYPGFNGTVAQSLRQFPQYRNIDWRGVPTGKSQYHAIELVVERRFSKGLQARFGYTYSHLNNNGAESAQGMEGINAGVQNPADPLAWQLSADDTPHVALTGFTWEVPGANRWTNRIAKMALSGWNISGILRYESGRPLNITIDNNLGGLLFNGQKRPNRVSGTDGVIAPGNFDPNADRYLDRGAWSDPGPLNFGNAPKRDTTVRSFPIYSEDINIFKVFPLANGHKMRFESMFGNIFNRTLFGEPNTNWSSPAFGQVFTQANSPRSIQVALRYDF
ncbi:MAG: TonB-dependent receptor [Vicinamibacteraceae bacterium]